MSSIVSVAAWELRRLHAARWMWLIGAAAFVFCVGLIELKHSWGRPVVDGVAGESIEILGTTAVGLPYLMISGLLTLFAVFVPFVATDGVAHDYRQRVHELLMTTPVSNAAYVWGRFLACLAVVLALDMLLLAAVVGMGPVLHATNLTYPMPDVGLVLGVWGVAILPASLMVAALSFLIGTLFPRVAGMAKLAVVLGWMSIVFLVDVLDHGGTWFTYWNPTSYGIVRVNVDAYLQTYLSQVAGVGDAAQRLAISQELQQRVPQLGPWVGPHLVLAAASLGGVAVAAARFGRFRRVLG